MSASVIMRVSVSNPLPFWAVADRTLSYRISPLPASVIIWMPVHNRRVFSAVHNRSVVYKRYAVRLLGIWLASKGYAISESSGE
jgi:hypothetical protein